MDLEAGVESMKRHMKSASFAKGSYSSMVKRNPILATFMVDRDGRYCLRAMHKGCAFFGCFIIVLGLVAGLVAGLGGEALRDLVSILEYGALACRF